VIELNETTLGGQQQFGTIPRSDPEEIFPLLLAHESIRSEAVQPENFLAVRKNGGESTSIEEKPNVLELGVTRWNDGNFPSTTRSGDRPNTSYRIALCRFDSLATIAVESFSGRGRGERSAA